MRLGHMRKQRAQVKQGQTKQGRMEQVQTKQDRTKQTVHSLPLAQGSHVRVGVHRICPFLALAFFYSPCNVIGWSIVCWRSWLHTTDCSFTCRNALSCLSNVPLQVAEGRIEGQVVLEAKIDRLRHADGGEKDVLAQGN